jgi:hypothetical protein
LDFDRQRQNFWSARRKETIKARNLQATIKDFPYSLWLSTDLSRKLPGAKERATGKDYVENYRSSHKATSNSYSHQPGWKDS